MPRAPWPACRLLLQLLPLLLLLIVVLMMAATASDNNFFLAVECSVVEQLQQQRQRQQQQLQQQLHLQQQQQEQHHQQQQQQQQHHHHNFFATDPLFPAADTRAVVAARASSGRVATFCPPPCPSTSSSSSTMTMTKRQHDNMTQCLYYLQESHKEEVCGRDIEPERRRAQLHQLRMRHCCEHAVDTALPEDAFGGGIVCERHLESLIHIDDIATRLSYGHAELLTRYDCAQNYSIAHDCKDCKEAYRRWVCSSLVPHYSRSGYRVLPCLSVCEDVEQQCPYLVPDQTVTPGEAAHPTPQYAGEPAFLCLDPNIPETGEQKLKSSHGDEDCCYTHCGSPGRGVEGVKGHTGGGLNYILGVCEHCPGRPHAAATATVVSKGARTFNQVSTLLLLLWTSFLITFLQTENVSRALIRCLLYSVRTFYRRFLKDRTHS